MYYAHAQMLDRLTQVKKKKKNNTTSNLWN